MKNELAAYQKHLDNLLTAAARKARIPGMCLEILANGHRMNACIGNLSVDRALPMTSSARFEMGGITHVLLSAVILEMFNRGELDIAAPIGTLIPELGGSKVGETVLVKHVLSHTGGYKTLDFNQSEVRLAYTWEKLVEFLRQTPVVFEPGTVFSYTPTGPVILVELIKRKTGGLAMEVAKARMLDALNLQVGRIGDAENFNSHNVISLGLDPRTKSFAKSTHIELCDLWMASLSDFTISLADLLTLSDSIARTRDGASNAHPHLSPATAQLMQEQVLGLPHMSGGAVSERISMSVGLGCAEFMPQWVGCNGPLYGQTCSLRYHAKERISLAVGMNVHAPLICDAVIFEVIRSLTGEVKLPEPEVEEASPSNDELAGTYSGLSGNCAIISVDEDGILCDQIQKQSRVRLRKDKFNRWAVASDPGPWPYGVFRDPRDGSPCLMIGVEAFRKD